MNLDVRAIFRRDPVKTMAMSQSTLAFRGRDFKITIYRVTADTFRRLGLNTKAFIPGVLLYVMDEDVYRVFCDWLSESQPPLSSGSPVTLPYRRVIDIPYENDTVTIFDHQLVGGMYPLARNGEYDAVRREESAALPDKSRIAILPADFCPSTLTHELAHDIFLGRHFSPQMRRSIVMFVIARVREAYLRQDQKALKFFEAVNKRCEAPYKLQALQDLDLVSLDGSDEIGPNLFAFAGECFAYGWERMLGGDDAELGEVPREFRLVLEKYPLGETGRLRTMYNWVADAARLELLRYL